MFNLYDNCILTYSLPNHKDIKEKILNSLSKGYELEDKSQSISNTDYQKDLLDSKQDTWEKDNMETAHNREYFKILYDSLQKHFHPLLSDHFQVAEYTLTNFWYQQYKMNNRHDWHYHGGTNLIAVYNLELPDAKFKTQFYDMFRKKDIEYIANEGDIVFTYAAMLHRSPPLISNERKTVISMNYNLIQVKNDMRLK